MIISNKIIPIASNVIKTIVLTRCESVPVSVCGSGCVTREGEEECQDTQVDFIIILIVDLVAFIIIIIVDLVSFNIIIVDLVAVDLTDETLNQVDSLTQVPEEVFFCIFPNHHQ